MLPWSLKSQSDLLTVDATMIPDIPIYNWSKSLFDFISTKTAVWLMHTNRKIWILIFNPELTTKVITKRQKSIKPHVKVGVTVENTHHSVWRSFGQKYGWMNCKGKNLKGRFPCSKQSTRTVFQKSERQVFWQQAKHQNCIWPTPNEKEGTFGGFCKPWFAFVYAFVCCLLFNVNLCMYLSVASCFMLICVCICLLLFVLC